LSNLNKFNLNSKNKMKKLLLTTAIASSALFAGNALAQTTVSGNLDVSLKGISSEKAGDGISSLRGMGRELQINIQNKGKLNNDMGYAAGFSLEHDGSQTGVNGLDENVYIDFISGNTTLTIGTDHIQNSDRTLGNFVGLIAEDLTNSTGGSLLTDIFRSDVGADPAQAYGIGIIQTFPGMATLSAWYSPNGEKNASAGTTVFVANDDQALDTTSESAYEIGITGGFGVKGLNTHAFMNRQDRNDANAAGDRDLKGYNYGLSYNFGQVTAGYNYKKHVNQTAAGAGVGTNKGDVKQNEYGIAYALTPNLTLGANYTKAEPTTTTVKADAKSRSIAVGYNLGAIALTAQAAKLDNYTGTDGVDADVLYLRASTKF
jgi:hypothetical protein